MSTTIDINKQFIHRQRTALSLAVVVAVILNGCLFALMPALITSDANDQLPAAVVSQVKVVRLPGRVVTRKVKPVEEEKPKSELRTSAKSQPKPIPNLSLSFVTNSKLPEKPSSLRLPPPNTALVFTPVVGDVFSAGELDVPMTILARTPPFYPLRARQRGIEGWVKVKLLVDEEGNVTEVSIVEAQPEGVFEKSVRRCVGSWRFQPGTVEGTPVKAQVETTVKFELE
ncbi:energy transducer TonB [Desulforhopalus singaporensis]|uniref:Protein TonB n=1 Tax=Desulforhopalus singaporensis TaxID=91360 RepID=A0A1H0SIK8_9BACT|nr:energy transducer TonB [Desulforhopalus singaporensis]SDP41495.1 protein TonB [Desulforhopalus singaporensis]